MSLSNRFTRPAGSISIPVEIVSSSASKGGDKPAPSFRPYSSDNLSNEFSHSPPPKKPSTTSYSRRPFQSRCSPIPTYDRLIRNSVFHQPSCHSFQPPTFERRTLHPGRSAEDLLFPSMDTVRPNNGPLNSTHFPSLFNNEFWPESDFGDFNKHFDTFLRSHDVLHDSPDAHQKFPTNRPYSFEQQQSDYPLRFVNPNEDRVSNDYQQPSNSAYDRSHSPVSQRDESPVRQAPPASHPQHESDFKMTQDPASPMPKPSTTATSSQSNDQQVPSADVASARDPNAMALDKLEQIKQHLADLNERVEIFAGSTRDDRLYKLLDEQAVKLMIRCDELVDVSADIKEKRRGMICNVQNVLAKLESKVPINPTVESLATQMETTPAAPEPTESHDENPST